MKAPLDKAFIVTSFLLAFLSFYAINIIVPMMSDDYLYSLLGLSIKSHYNHYMRWSGRVVPDFIASLTTNAPNKIIVSIINSLAPTLLIYNIAMLAKAIRKDITYLEISLIFALIFILFWVSNPSLGSAVFWDVGAANYIWPALIGIFYIRILLIYQERKKKPGAISLLFLFSLALLAGASSEIVSLSLVVGVALLFIFEARKTGAIPVNILVGGLGGAIGSAILFLAPGNFSRAQQEGYNTNISGILFRGVRYFLVTFNETMSLNSYVFFSLFITSVFFIFSRDKAFVTSKATSYLLFLFLFIFSTALATITPPLPDRALVTQLFFLLCFLSIGLASLGRKSIISVSIITIGPMLPFFLFNYYLLHQNYESILGQSVVIKNIIDGEKKNHNLTVGIPHFFDRGLAKKNDVTENYMDLSVAKYYGLDSIYPFFVNFDYSIINKGCEYGDRLQGSAKDYIICVRSYQDLSPRQKTFVFEVDKSKMPRNKILSVKINTDRGQSHISFDDQYLVNSTFVYPSTQFPAPLLTMNESEVMGRRFYFFTTNYFERSGARILSIELSEEDAPERDTSPLLLRLQ
ncbi:DUF6056 family protein [Paraburkholderia sp. DGU8]|uniref:DUF6056 family protein n=1 Tax=Paraburkholderia sp. DGU8 TaxID=3161997 RepID=UPI003465E93E